MTLSTLPKRSPPHQKRINGHIPHTHHNLKPYWPYLPIIAIVFIGGLINLHISHTSQVLGAQSNISATALLSATNQQRTTYRETALNLNSKLDTAAINKAHDMIAHNYWAHTSPSGVTGWSFINSAGYTYQLAGENLAYGFSNAQSAINAWMQSPEHRANILTSSYSDVGFGVASSPNFMGHGPETVIVALYAQPAVTTISFTVPSHAVAAATPHQPSIAISRVSLLKSQPSIELVVMLSGLIGASFAVVVTLHARAWHKALVRGETFIVRHPLFDIVIVALAVSCFVLTRTAGYII
jgi:uncharacterized protein YkwD